MSRADSFVVHDTPGDDFVYLAAFQQLVLERVHDLVTVMDPLGTIVYASPSWNTLLGWDPDAIAGTPFAAFAHPEEREAAPAAGGEPPGSKPVEPLTAPRRARE